MAKKTSIYRRLTGRHRTLTGHSQLWLGPGYLMLLKSTRFVEEYQRFAFSDIQAIVVTRLPERTVFHVGAVATAIAWTLGALAVSSIFAKGFFGVTGVLALAAIFADIARGPRCRCHLYTAVSRELLAPVSRMRTAAAFLSQLRPEIEAVQGRLPSEVIGLTDPVGAPEPVERPPDVPDAPGYLPEALFALLLVNALLVLMDIRFPQTEASSVLLSTFAAEVVIGVVALFRQARDPRRFIFILVIVAILCMGWDMVGLGRSVGTWFGAIAESARRQQSTPPTFSWAPSQQAAMFAYGWRLAAGVIGLGTAYYERRQAVRHK